MNRSYTLCECYSIINHYLSIPTFETYNYLNTDHYNKPLNEMLKGNKDWPFTALNTAHCVQIHFCVSPYCMAKLLATQNWIRHSFHQNFLTNSLVLSNPVLFASQDYNITNSKEFNRVFVKAQSPEGKSTGFERTSEFVRKSWWKECLIQSCEEISLVAQFSREPNKLIWTQ